MVSRVIRIVEECLDINMPKSCAECPYKSQLDESGIWFCDRLATDDSDTDVSANGKPFDFRPDYCPLVEVSDAEGR